VNKPGENKTGTHKPAKKWHGVMVVLNGTSCAAAALCRNSRFLASEAPKLPLPACTHPDECRCTYRHFEDRRNGPRRTEEIGGLQADKPEVNRRKSRGRRARDRI
jgi:hypothetical protein